MSITSGYGPDWTTEGGRVVELQRRVVELEQQLAAAQAEAREWQRVATEQAQLHADDTSRLEAEAQELRERAEKAERNYQWMVERAADQHLSGYRELARRAADAENVADGLRAEVRELQRVQSDVLANLDAAPDDMDVISAAHFVAGALTTAEEALEAAQAEARELRAELARVRELCPEVIAFAHLMQHKLNMNAHKDGEGWGRDSSGKRGWKSCSPQFLMDKLHEEALELTSAIHAGDSAKSIRQEAADVGNIAMMLADVCGALSQPAEQHDPLAVSDHCGECGEPEPECACDERIEDYRPAAQESGDAQP